jgi:hypothetical protein
MKFDANGKRIAPAPINPAAIRTPAYWFEQEKINENGFCDEPIPDPDLDSVTHPCGRFFGHGGRCACIVKTESGGRTTRRLVYG